MRMNLAVPSRLAGLLSAPTDLKTHVSDSRLDARPQYKEIFHRKSGEDFSKKTMAAYCAGRLGRCFLWCQPAIQWWQLELPLQRDSSFQSSQAAESWELELSQE